MWSFPEKNKNRTKNVTLMNHSQVMQNNAARLMLDFPVQVSGTKALELLKWQPLHLRRCLAVFKAVNGDVDFNFGLRRNIEFHEHFTRRRHNFRLPKDTTNWRKQMFKYFSLKDLNSFKSDIKQSTSIDSFKTKMCFEPRFSHCIRSIDFLTPF